MNEIKNYIMSLENVSFYYEKGNYILNNINLNIEKGKCYFLTGDNGSGKSTLLKLLYLEKKPSAGNIHIFNQNIDDSTQYIPTIKQNMGVIFQDFKLINHLSVFENIALPLSIKGQKKAHIIKKVNQIIEWIGLKEHINSLPIKLSGGQQQRVAIARAVIGLPKIIIADELTSNIDNTTIKYIVTLFKQLQKNGTTIILATHNLELLKQNEFIHLHIQNGILTYV